MTENQKTFNKGGKEHSTQKPLLLMERLIELLTPPDALVLDSFLWGREQQPLPVPS